MSYIVSFVYKILSLIQQKYALFDYIIYQIICSRFFINDTYTGKFALHVLDLTQIDKATAEDKHYAIDKWATLFKATTWEELHMITKNDKAMTEASKTLYEMNADQTIRDMCYFQEHAIIEENYRNDLIKRQQAELAEKDSKLAEKDSELAEKDSKLAEKDSELTAKDHIIANLMAQLQAKDNE